MANDTSTDPVVAELIAIKRLIAFWLLKSGVSQDEIGKAMGSSQAQISRMFAKSKSKAKRK